MFYAGQQITELRTGYTGHILEAREIQGETLYLVMVTEGDDGFWASFWADASELRPT